MDILYTTAEWRAGVSSPDRLTMEGVAVERKRSQSVSGLEGGQEVQRTRALSGQERQKKWTKNNEKKVQIKDMKRNLGVSIAKEKDPEIKNAVNAAARIRKQKERNRKKNLLENKENEENTLEENADIPPKKSCSLPAQKSRQKDYGDKQRKTNRKAKNETIDEMKAKIIELEAAKKQSDDDVVKERIKTKEFESKVNDLQNKIEDIEYDIKDDYVWAGEVYRNMSSEGKREYRKAFTIAAPKLKRGTISRLRKQTGMNFSNLTENNVEEMSEIKHKIVEFAKENTIEVPDKRKSEKGIRYRSASLQCLFDNFEIQLPNICTYQTFCRYWPSKYIKPKPSEWGTCLCIICQNFELKFEALRARKLISLEHSLDHILERTRKDDFDSETAMKLDIESLAEEEKAEVNVAFHKWEKVKQTEVSKNTGKAKCDKTMRMVKTLAAKELGKIVLEDYEDYKNHLERDHVMKTELKKVRVEAEEEDDKAVIHMDWAEQHKLIEHKEVQSAFFNGRRSYDIHTGYCYTKGDSHGFASLSDSSNHKAEAIIAAIEPKIKDLVEKRKTKIILCSDSPTSQYRNAKYVFLMKLIALKYGINIRHLYTEAGYGKSPCDGVGGNIKTEVEAALQNEFGIQAVTQIESAEDVKKLIKEKTNLTYDITVHNQETSKEIDDSLPKLGPLVGALKIHEIVITSEGVIKKKNLPNENSYSKVNIRESRKKRKPELNEAMIVDDESVLEETGLNLVPENIQKRIMTDAEIEAELEQSDSESDYDY